MQLSTRYLALIASALTFILTQSAARHGYKHRRVDWNNPALYDGVDWATVNYGGPATAPTPAAAAPPEPLPSASPPQQGPAAPAEKNVNPKPSVKINQAPASPPTSSGGKRGLAYNPGGPSLDLFDSSSTINWAYDWDSTPGELPSKFQFVPLLFSGESIHTGQWNDNVEKATGPTKYLMSFNEPDMTIAVGGSAMDVATAVQAFNTYMKPYAGRYKLGSPAVSNGQGINPDTHQPQGLDWLKPFLQQCSACQISFAPVHWYGCQNGCSVQEDINSFKSTVQSAMSVTNLPVWVTEFQCLGDAETFLDEVLPWLDGQPGVERYSYFMVRDGILTNGGALSQIGSTYAS